MKRKDKSKTIIKIISKILKINNHKINSKLKLGDIPEWDSLSHMSIFIELKKKYKKIDLNSASRVKSISYWINLIND